MRKNTMRDNLISNTNLDRQDIDNLGSGFRTRMDAVRRQMRKWNERGYSFRRVMSWGQEKHNDESKLPMREVKRFWREVDLLKGVILLAEFCKANGLDTQKELEKNVIENRREAALNRMLEKYAEVGVSCEMLEPFLSSQKMLASELPPEVLDGVGELIANRAVGKVLKRRWMEEHPETNRRRLSYLEETRTHLYAKLMQSENAHKILPTQERAMHLEYWALEAQVKREMAAADLMKLRERVKILKKRKGKTFTNWERKHKKQEAPVVYERRNMFLY
ncbi:MAG: hypothetical protein II938_03150 [Alphaproteobacteria bacterium]|nr:hypothetical protein [Alphaproteobacteria bacterium]